HLGKLPDVPCLLLMNSRHIVGIHTPAHVIDVSHLLMQELFSKLWIFLPLRDGIGRRSIRTKETLTQELAVVSVSCQSLSQGAQGLWIVRSVQFAQLALRDPEIVPQLGIFLTQRFILLEPLNQSRGFAGVKNFPLRQLSFSSLQNISYLVLRH